MKDLILKHFASICGMLLDQLENWKDLEKALDKVAQLADMRLIEIMSKRQRFVATEVMFYYHVRQKNVMTIINSLSRSKSGPAVSCNASLSNFLIQNHTLSDMLTVATCHIKRKGIGRYSGEFRSLIDVIHIAGSEGVRQVQSLIAPLLNFCVRLLNQTNDDYELIAEFYSAYLQNVPFKILGQNLLLICKDLYEQLLPKHKAKAIQLLERVICGHLDLLKAALRQVSFVRKREDADFSRLNKAIDFICAKYPEEAAIDYVKFRTREIAGTRECMLKVLKIGDLRNYISRHYETLIIADSVDPCISPLISVLLNDAKHPDEELTLAIARCLGEIGAIDPARFDTIPASDPCPENEIFSHDIGSKSVLKKLVSKVSRSSVSFSDLNSQWLIMFVLQELMQSIALNDHPAFLRLLDNDVRYDCESVTDSQFTISPECVTREVELIPPASSVFHFRESSSDPLLKYENWLRIWAKRMILKMTKRSAAYKVLMGCAPLFAKDYRLTECLLPCVVFNFLCDEGISANDKTRIFFNEIDAVITSVVPKDYLSSHPNTFENSTCGTSDVVVSAPVLNELQHLSAQQIFVVYEKLQQWNASLKAPLVHELSANLTPQCLAALAYACRSHARSILYLEKHFREMKVKERPSYLMQLLQKNFIALEEPDGVVGVETCCIDPPSLIDRVMANESTCQLRQALTFCDKAARSEPDEIAYPKLVTRCLLSLDLTQQAYYHAIGLVSRSEKWGRAILPLQIQAAWRLSMWPELTQLLEQVTYDEEETGMNVHFGRILSHISQKDTDGLCRTLDAVRCIALNPVAAVVSEKGAYLRCYSSLVKLHMITDMQRAALDLCDMKPEPNTRHEAGVEVLGSIWKFRNKSIMASCQTLEPVLSMQRVLCSIYPQNKQDELAQQLAESWLKSATIARKSANLPKAENCVLELESLMAKDVVTSCTGLLSRVMVEVAKCYWAGQDSSSKERAVKYLSRGIEKYFSTFIVTSGRSAQAADDSRKDYARVRLLHTQFLAESQAADSKILIAGYTDAMMADKQWEKPAFRLARLYDRIAAHTIKHTDKVGLMYNACYYYFVSLQRGCKKIYRSLPRLIDLWCDMGTIDVFFTTALQVSSDRQSGVPAGEGNSRRTALSDRPRRSVKNVVVTDERHEEIRVTQALVRKEFQKLMSNIFVNIHKVLPSEYLYTAFSQMLSLTTHSNEMLTKCLCDILARVVYEHPQQCVWLILPAVMSDTDSVVAAANRILSTAATTSEERSFNKLMKEAGKLFWDVAHAGEKISKAVKKIDLSRLGPGDKLKKLLTDSRILLPYRKFMRVEMPPGGLRDDKHKYFASPVTIAGVEDEVDIFHSVARPKKITLIGSDGNRYPLLVKPKDDMRMDSRTMELIEVVNRLLRKDAESRKRQLSIRSFHVVPLGSAGGLVEFIDGVRDIRQILLDEYARSGMIDPKTFLKDVKDKYPEYKETSQSVARTKFQKDVIPMVQPAVFGSWFMRQFTDASGWHVARNEFTRSLAVMSIVGYVVGLGDRHLENILLDTATGQVIHVDFNLLFNNGKSLQVPEVVPFRLTHNLIDVMGVTGYEGHFRKTCEITLQVMRNNREELLSVLKPFVFDPFAGHDAQSNKKSFAEKVSDIVSSRGSATARDIEKIEVQDETAVADLAGIDDRLRGCIENDTVEYALPLSVAGQVNLLIKVCVSSAGPLFQLLFRRSQDATDPDKLCRMYVGWASYL